jgi:hypothetical protein
MRVPEPSRLPPARVPRPAPAEQAAPPPPVVRGEPAEIADEIGDEPLCHRSAVPGRKVLPFRDLHPISMPVTSSLHMGPVR